MSGRGIVPFAIPFIVGVAFLLGTVVTFARTLIFVAGANKTEATYVSSVARAGGNHGGTFLHPQFTFTTQDGRIVTMTSSSGATDQPYDNGQKVAVLYDAHDPSHAEIDSVLTLWLATLLLAPFALMFTTIAAAVFLLIRRRRIAADLG
jgi:hypothetical protein